MDKALDLLKEVWQVMKIEKVKVTVGLSLRVEAFLEDEVEKTKRKGTW